MLEGERCYPITRKLTYCWWTKSCTTKDDDYPIIYRVLTIPGGCLRFLPSTVSNMHISKVDGWKISKLMVGSWQSCKWLNVDSWDVSSPRGRWFWVISRNVGQRRCSSTPERWGFLLENPGTTLVISPWLHFANSNRACPSWTAGKFRQMVFHCDVRLTEGNTLIKSEVLSSYIICNTYDFMIEGDEADKTWLLMVGWTWSCFGDWNHNGENTMYIYI